MLPPISGAPPLNRKEARQFLINLARDKKTGPVPTPKLKEAERKIREKYHVSS